jgi:hypothetical protein
VKTINPMVKEAKECPWKTYTEAQAKGWFPGNVQIEISKEDSDFFHYRIASRRSMFDDTYKLEQKIAEGKLIGTNTCFVLALCSNGFTFYQDWLKDFVSYYYSGIHRGDDPLKKWRYMISKITVKFLTERFLVLLICNAYQVTFFPII